MGSWKSLKTDGGTGWKGIYREAGTGWKALTWEGVPIDIGAACIDRPTSTGMARTYLSKGNPANASGTLTYLYMWMNAAAAYDVYVGTFYLISGTTYKCRAALNLGPLGAGENSGEISLAVGVGDLIGFHGVSDSNRIEASSTGEAGHYYSTSGLNACVVDLLTAFTSGVNWGFSVYGTG